MPSGAVCGATVAHGRSCAHFLMSAAHCKADDAPTRGTGAGRHLALTPYGSSECSCPPMWRRARIGGFGPCELRRLPHGNDTLEVGVRLNDGVPQAHVLGEPEANAVASEEGRQRTVAIHAGIGAVHALHCRTAVIQDAPIPSLRLEAVADECQASATRPRRLASRSRTHPHVAWTSRDDGQRQDRR